MDNQFLEEIDEITYTIEFLVDQLHEALESGRGDAEAIALKIRQYSEFQTST